MKKLLIVILILVVLATVAAAPLAKAKFTTIARGVPAAVQPGDVLQCKVVADIYEVGQPGRYGVSMVCKQGRIVIRERR